MNKRVIATLMVLTLAFGTTAYADTQNTQAVPSNGVIQTPLTPENEGIMLISEQPVLSADFGYFEGKVTAISNTEYGTNLSVKSGDTEATFVVTKGTYVHNKKDFKVGQTLRGYFDNNAPMIMIYPAQYTLEALVFVDDMKNSVEVDTFDADLVNKTNMLKLTVSKDVKIADEVGKVYTGSLVGKKLFVEYAISTRSIPAQTTPLKIVVLKTATQEYNESIDYSKMDLLVADKTIKAGRVTNLEGVAMVELRSVVEALGLSISYDAKTATVYAGMSQMKIGVNSYSFGKMAPVELEKAPVVIKGRTHVPLSYFREVLQMSNAYVLENQVVINDYEKME